MKVTMFSQVSIDGKLTLGKGKSSKKLFDLLSEENIKYIHKFRGNVDGIMVGNNTIKTDNPSLTCRYDSGENPIRIIPTTTMKIPEDSSILNDGIMTVFITCVKDKDKVDKIINKHKNKHVIVCKGNEINFAEAFKELEEKFNIKSIMLEGGGMLNWSILKEGLVDELVIMQLPIIIGGENNVSLVDGEGYKDMDYVKHFKFSDCEKMQDVLLLRYKKESNKLA